MSSNPGTPIKGSASKGPSKPNTPTKGNAGTPPQGSPSTVVSPSKPLFPRGREPIGWAFEDVYLMSKDLETELWFIPWNNIAICDHDMIPASILNQHKFVIRHIDVNVQLNSKYFGRGIVVNMTTGRVEGCYKIHRDTEDGDDTKTMVQRFKGNRQFNFADQQRVLSIPKKRRTAEQKQELDTLEEDVREYGADLRRAHGLLLDPRPRKIAFHDPPIYRVHTKHVRESTEGYGDCYQVLEWRVRAAMGSTFKYDEDMPYWRKDQDRNFVLQGGKLRDFSDEKIALGLE